MVRWSGVFAPNSCYRKLIAPNPSVKKGFQFEDDAAPGPDASAPPKRKFKNYTWSKMLAKVFKFEVTVCPDCGGTLQKIAAVLDPQQVRRYLRHVGLEYEAPARAPPRRVQGSFHYEDEVSPEQYDADGPT